MDSGTERIFDQLRSVVHDLDGMLKVLLDAAPEQAGAAVDQVQEAAGRVRDKLGRIDSHLIQELRSAAGSTDRYVRSNPWLVLGAAVAAAFAAGLLLGRRDRG